MKGFFRVYENPDQPGDIYFEQIELGADETVPDEQREFIVEIGKTISVLEAIFEGDEYRRYFINVMSLAQVGVSGESAQTALAARMLESLQHEIVNAQGGRIKNGYMIALGARALVLCLGGIAVALMGNWINNTELADFGIVWAGCMVGVWLSFGIRRVTMSFENLHVIEADHLAPWVRLFFAGLLTLVLALMLQVELLSFQVGAFSTENFPSSWQIGVLFGLLSGISEKALSERVALSASRLLSDST